MAGDLLHLTVIIPTRNEAPNVAEMLSRLDSALGDLDAEILFVDDSDDCTLAAIASAASGVERTVRVQHRDPQHRQGGLSGAVLAGMRSASAPWAVVLDGDLQHPPELVPMLLDVGRTERADLVYGTRYGGSGDTSGLSGRIRVMVSVLCTLIAKIAFPRRLKGITDPMSGLFAVRLGAVPLGALRPTGYKILLEVLARSSLSTVCALPYAFQPRFAGESKASVREGLRFLRHLTVLRLSLSEARLGQLARFLGVGLSGVVVNTTVLSSLTTSALHVPYLAASIIATHVSILWNFVLLERFVLRGVGTRPFLSALSRFWLLNVALLPVQLGLLALMVEVWNFRPVPANVLVLGMVFIVRYLATLGWVYGWKPTPVDAVVATPAQNLVEPAAELAGRSHRAGREPRRYLLRLVLPPLVTLVAFPAAAVHLALAMTTVTAMVTSAAAISAGMVLAAVRSAPDPSEPDVHDRQLDVILALPLLAAALWLELGWADRPSLQEPLHSRDVVALALFLAATCLLLLGTRLTARLRWVLCLPLLALPWLGLHPDLRAALVTLIVVMAGLALVRHVRRGEARRHLASGRWQLLPRLQVGAASIGLVALALGSVAISAVP
jgi:putative flippase GtrA